MAIIKQYDKRTGTTYVYESHARWDKKKKYSVAKRTLIGKIDKVTGEIVPTDQRVRRKREKAITPTTPNVARKRYGATYALQTIAKQTGLQADLKSVFPDAYQDILSLAYYLVLSPNNRMKNYGYWAEEQVSYGKKRLTSQRISELFSSVKEEHKQAFFKYQAKRQTKQDFWVYDTTSISSYSKTLDYVQYGHNKERRDLPQLNLALVYGEHSQLPIMYRHLSGNIPDAKTIEWLMSLFDGLEKDSIQLVMDRGFYKQSNVQLLCEEQITFVLGAKKGVRDIKEAIEQVRETIEQPRNYNRQYKVYQSKGTVKSFKASEHSYYPVYAHIYYDVEQAAGKRQAFDEQVLEWQEELANEKVLKESVSQYFSEDGELNLERIQAKKRDMGYFVLLTNSMLESGDVLRIYREKDVVEKAFENLKDRLNMKRVSVSSERSLEGKIFLQYIGLILVAHLKRLMRRSHLDEKYSMEELLILLNRIERFEHPEYGYTVGEILEKQADILEKLTIPLPR